MGGEGATAAKPARRKSVSLLFVLLMVGFLGFVWLPTFLTTLRLRDKDDAEGQQQQDDPLKPRHVKRFNPYHKQLYKPALGSLEKTHQHPHVANQVNQPLPPQQTTRHTQQQRQQQQRDVARTMTMEETLSTSKEWKPLPEPAVPAEFAHNASAFWSLLRQRHRQTNSREWWPDLLRRQLSHNYSVWDMPRVSVLLWPLATLASQSPKTAEHKHIFRNGLEESLFLTDASFVPNNKRVGHSRRNRFDVDHNNNTANVWMADPGHGWTWETWCNELYKAVQSDMIQRYQHGQPTQWPIFVADFTDPPGRQRCVQVEDLMMGTNEGQQQQRQPLQLYQQQQQPPLVQYTARAVTTHRRWSKRMRWVRVGTFNQGFPMVEDAVRLLLQRYGRNNHSRYYYNDMDITTDHIKELEETAPFLHDYRHTPLTVRTDLVQEMELVLQEDYHGISLSDPAIEFTLPRPVDVTHFWPRQETSKNNNNEVAVNQDNANLRTRVSQLLHDYGKELGWTTFLGLQGQALKEGRNAVARAYLQAMLETKIVVVTQRDRWEDHYRLLEALVSGALVVTDFMYGLPAGLRNGSSIVVFSNAHELRSLVVYYLEHAEERKRVAQRGRFVAMTRHRSWHRLEEIVFGEILSTCLVLVAKGYSTKDSCPYIVHTTTTAAATAPKS